MLTVEYSATYRACDCRGSSDEHAHIEYQASRIKCYWLYRLRFVFLCLPWEPIATATKTRHRRNRFSTMHSPWFWVSYNCTKWPIQGSFESSSLHSLNGKKTQYLASTAWDWFHMLNSCCICHCWLLQHYKTSCNKSLIDQVCSGP